MLTRFVFLITFFLPVFSWAQNPSIKPVDTTGVTDLIHESETVSVLSEVSVQREERSSIRMYGFSVGMMQNQSVVVQGRNELFDYELGQKSPAIQASFSYLPWVGIWSAGFDFGVSYLTQEGFGRTSNTEAQLHMVTAEPSFFVQKDLGRYVTPRLGVGYGVSGFFQRGYDDENTSESENFGFYYGAVDLHWSKWFSSIDLDWSLTLKHEAAFGTKSALNTAQIQRTSLGVSLSL